MARLKIDFGIDLGTTNSGIARIEEGKSKRRFCCSHKEKGMIDIINKRC